MRDIKKESVSYSESESHISSLFHVSVGDNFAILSQICSQLSFERFAKNISQ